MKKKIKIYEIFVLIFLTVTLLLVPLSGDRFYIYLACMFLIYSVYAIGFNILFHYGRLLSFGHAMFFAGGAYATALFTLRIYSDPVIGFLIGVLASLPLALIVGFLSLRHTRIYFALLTLAFSMFLYTLLLKLRDITGGSDGLVGIPKKGILDLSSPISYYYFIYVISVLFVIIPVYFLLNSRIGLIIKALGSNEERLPFTGYSILNIRLLTFIISGIITSVSGSLYAILMGVITPEIAYWTYSAVPLVITLIGGSNYFFGPILGALVYLILTTLFARFAEFWQLILGIAIMAVVLGFKGGMAEMLTELLFKIKPSLRGEV
ncbi:MAG: branched-chain amino acid ABC transporter permease [Saccharolobus sp.]|uniref:branched-chain amino acid ABC transporter permease n=1 Tax=Saccharolobus sp. TaxID=2100761 RepID=UPI0031704FB5